MKAYLESASVPIALLFLGFSIGSRPLHAAEPSDVAWARVKDHWTEIVTSVVTGTTLPDSVPADISNFCPAYDQGSKPDRIHFWVGLIASVANAETGGRFNPRDSYTEPMHEHGLGSPLVVSRGLLQLSFPGDRDAYQYEIADAEALYDPSVNLACGVKILAKLVTRDQRIAGQVGSAPCTGRPYVPRVVRMVRTPAILPRWCARLRRYRSVARMTEVMLSFAFPQIRGPLRFS